MMPHKPVAAGQRASGSATNVHAEALSEFNTVDSQRLRLGTRLDGQLSESASVYVGAAWEHEFNGEPRATTYGIETPAPTVEGDTGVFDLGLPFTPTPNLTVEAGLTGYAGMRQGIGGSAPVKYSF